MHKHRYFFPLSSDAPNIEVIGANHEVHVLGALIYTSSRKLVGGHVKAALVALGKAHAQCQVAGSVLVVERVVEEQPALADRSVLGDQRTLSQVASALIGRKN